MMLYTPTSINVMEEDIRHKEEDIRKKTKKMLGAS